MAANAKQGICHLCGRHGKLSFEHVPPRKAFNDHGVVAQTIDDILAHGKDAKTEICQRGVGAYTLCQPCNNNTGSWYGPHYVEWVHQGMSLLHIAQESSAVSRIFGIRPLAVIKQIACMFFSVNGPEFRKAQPDLARFVLDRERRYLPDNLTIYVFYCVGPKARQAGVVGRVDLLQSSRHSTFTEIAFPPFGYVLTFDEPPHRKMLDISEFSRYDYRESRALGVSIPVLPIIGYMPGDYRSEEQIKKAGQQSIEPPTEE